LLQVDNNQELKAYDDNNCKFLSTIKKEKVYDQEVLSSHAIKSILKAAKNDEKLKQCLMEADKDLEKPEWATIARIVDFCVTNNFNFREEDDYKCPASIMKWVPAFHDYKHYGLYNRTQFGIKGKNIATSILVEFHNM